MLTIANGHRTLRSRPMLTQEEPFDGTLWFFTRADEPTETQLAGEPVNVSYSSPSDSRYVSVSGVARVVRDPQALTEHWRPDYLAWFPEGLNDPQLALLRIEAQEAEYWDLASGKLVQLLGFARSLASGSPYDLGEHERFEMDHGRLKEQPHAE
jgi:general stress protein 26